jgi:endonuclease/exonuclease/phosphatase (EEP) superfamily protein YafD
MRALTVAAVVLGALAVLGTSLAFVRLKAWWIRIWDFPRAQLATAAGVSLAVWAWSDPSWATAEAVAAGVLAAALLWQLVQIWRYTSLAPHEVQRARAESDAGRITLVMSNVLQTNRQADRLLQVLRDADADIVLCVETDDWWRQRLDRLTDTHPYAQRCALPNTYGMLLYSRLPLEAPRTDFLLQPDIPSMQAHVRLRSGARVWLNCVHPRPPAPGESEDSLERDVELLLVGERVRDAREPVVVCGDLNDVAWSRTTRLFQKVSGLLDPRKGRGMYSTFHARWPGMRWPLDHVFVSRDFRLVSLDRLPYVGSDHFPVCVTLSHEPPAAAEQEAPEAEADDIREAEETLREGARELPSRARGSAPDATRGAS